MQKHFQPNEMIGEYRVVRFLGSGGMGEVYQGVHAKLNRAAAIKVLSQTTSGDASFAERFFNEAQLQASLHHPNVAALYDFSEIGGQLFIFMEFVDGESLEDLVNRRAFTVEDALKTFESICEAIAFIHRNGIVHRDIKSQNIKLTSGGTVKMLDFGIAKSAKSQNLTQVGGVIGTPHYLAPEQLEGEPATAQTDIWALGVLLYEMLTGNLPFESETLASLCMQITTANFAPPENSNPAISKAVSRIVSRCLKRNLAECYLNVDEILADVRRVLSGEKTSAASRGKTFALFGRSENKIAAQNARTDYSDFQTAPSEYVSGDYAPVETAGKIKKGLPLSLIAAAVSILVFALFVAVGAGVYLMKGAGGDSENHTVSDMKSDKSSTALVISSGGANKQIKIDVDEVSAQIFRGGESLGATPLDLNVKEGEKIDLTLKRDGFADKAVQFEASGKVADGRKNVRNGNDRHRVGSAKRRRFQRARRRQQALSPTRKQSGNADH